MRRLITANAAASTAVDIGTADDGSGVVLHTPAVESLASTSGGKKVPKLAELEMKAG